ncbi:N-formylglutamate amidohydrolase [Burkholderiaceae bacterium FT117]|uniref:N-formylglutamate amidohydrolase n=1 Tax=Zeimonas sediminis TaxID=2944268 RepID=UPI002342D53C|nr:N-formylglutamate amidohydrolase [Zeimonas sediminis]MCM5571968.1 N-formylglutamate amidohydrolase [Zeimonas sediminis]
MTPEQALALYGPDDPREPLLLDSPHSGREFPADFDAIVSEFDLRDGEDCFIDELYLPATELGVSLIAARFPRTWLDPNRHHGDIDLDLIEGGSWPHEYRPSGKARLGKALVWRTLDDGRPIYGRRLRVDEVLDRIERGHRPYHRALQGAIDATHARFGVSYHLNCHSMNPVAGVQGEGGAGAVRADFVLGDRDGSTCEAGFTAFVREVLSGMGYEVKVNDPYKGVELVRAYSDPAAGRHSLQLEINKRLYMDPATREPNEGFAALQANLRTLVDALLDYTRTKANRHD